MPSCNIFNQLKSQFVMLGLAAVGKTTSLYKLKLGDIENLVSMIGLNFAKLQGKHLDFISWAKAGNDYIKLINLGDVFFVNKEKMKEEHIGKPFLIFANIQDRSQMNSSDFASQINLKGFLKDLYPTLQCNNWGRSRRPK